MIGAVAIATVVAAMTRDQSDSNQGGSLDIARWADGTLLTVGWRPDEPGIIRYILYNADTSFHATIGIGRKQSGWSRSLTMRLNAGRGLEGPRGLGLGPLVATTKMLEIFSQPKIQRRLAQALSRSAVPLLRSGSDRAMDILSRDREYADRISSAMRALAVGDRLDSHMGVGVGKSGDQTASFTAAALDDSGHYILLSFERSYSGAYNLLKATGPWRVKLHGQEIDSDPSLKALRHRHRVFLHEEAPFYAETFAVRPEWVHPGFFQVANRWKAMTGEPRGFLPIEQIKVGKQRAQ